MAELGEYIYCIIPCQKEHTFDVAGMGENGNMVHTVSCRGLAAVVSATAVKQYESTRSNMLAHERVLETVMKEATLLPVRFGTVADSVSSVEDIRKLLSVRFEEFQNLLQDLQDKIELGVKAFWRDEKAIFEEIVAENVDIRRLRDSVARKPPGAAHFERIRLGEMIEEAINRKKAREAAQILEPLRRIACDTRENPVLATRIVLNAAFLVAKTREPEFDRAVTGLDGKLGKRIASRYIGPVPAYNFVNIVVNWQEIRAAQEIR